MKTNIAILISVLFSNSLWAQDHGHSSPSASVTDAATKPNVVLILVDDIGIGWMPPYADRLKPTDIEPEIVTSYAKERNKGEPLDLPKYIEAARSCMPFLSKLAKEGMLFDRCFATASLCAPSRAGLLTGTFQQRWGAYDLAAVDDHGIPVDRTVLAEPLKVAGYHCGMIGKWHVAKKDDTIRTQIWTKQMGETLPIQKGFKGRGDEFKKYLDESAYQSSAASGQHPLDRGFDYYFGYNSHGDKYYNSDSLWENRSRVPQRPEGEFLTDLLSDKACTFVESSLAEQKPFFLYYAPMTLHGAILPPPAKYSAPFNTGTKFADEYAGHLLALDEGIKKIFDVLGAHGQLGNTLFILSCDNGCTLYDVPPYNAPNRGGKGTGWLGGLNVPLIIWDPGLVQPGINQQIVSLADLMPTVLDAVGLPTPKGIDGLSLLPYLRGETKTGPRKSLGSSGLHSSRWSYCYEAGGEMNKKDSQECPLYAWYLDENRLLMRITAIKPDLYNALPNGLPDQTMLFDLTSDRQERENIRSVHPEQAAAMDLQLHQWLSGMHEPLTSQKADYHTLLEDTSKVSVTPSPTD